MRSDCDSIRLESKPVLSGAGVQVRLDVKPPDLERLKRQADQKGLSMAAYSRMAVLARIEEDEQTGELEAIKGKTTSAPSVSPKIAMLRLRDEAQRRMSRGVGKNFNDVANEVSRVLEPYRSDSNGERNSRYLLGVEATTLLAEMRAAAKEMDKALDLGDVELAELWTRRTTSRGLKLLKYFKAGTSTR